MEQQKFWKFIANTTQHAGFIIGIVIVLVLVNLISIRYFSRVDLTQEKQYTLSETSRNMMKGLDDLLTVKVYFSKTLPPELANTSQYVHDILSEYSALSSNLQVEYIDPASGPEITKEVQDLGIPQVQMNFFQKDRVEVQNGYLGIGFFYGGKKEIIPVVENTQNLEYQITSIIKKVTTSESKRVGFLTGNGEPSIYEMPFEGISNPDAYIEAKKALEKIYEVNSITLKNGYEIKNFDTLIVAGTRETITERELFEIDQFIMKGGNVLFFVDPSQFTVGLNAEVNNTGLEKILRNLGVDLHSNLILDTSTELVTFSTAGQTFLTPYPFWVKTLHENFSQDNPVVAKVDSVVFPWVSSLALVPKQGVEGTVLIKSSAEAWKMTPPYNVDPSQRITPSNFSQYDLAVIIRGKFTSLYPNQKPPAIELVEGQEPVAEDPDRVSISESQKESTIVVIGDGEFIADRYIARFPQNMEFFLNMVDYVTLDPSLISIRAKSVMDRPVKQISDARKQAIKWINIIGVPVVVVVFGVGRMVWRKKKYS